jgi:hypothetical protein
MVQIASISATTAGYVTEGLRPAGRVDGATQNPERVAEQIREARKADLKDHQQMRDVVGPPAIALFFMTAGERNQLLGHTTQREAEDAYLFAEEGGEEYRAQANNNEQEDADEDESAADDSDDTAEDVPVEERADDGLDAFFSDPDTEVLALPAPAEPA